MQLIRFLFSISWMRIAAVIAAGLICGVANTYLLTLIRGVVSPSRTRTSRCGPSS